MNKKEFTKIYDWIMIIITEWITFNKIRQFFFKKKEIIMKSYAKKIYDKKLIYFEDEIIFFYSEDVFDEFWFILRKVYGNILQSTTENVQKLTMIPFWIGFISLFFN